MISPFSRRCFALCLCFTGVGAGAVFAQPKIETDAVCGIYIDGETPTFKVTAGTEWRALNWRGDEIDAGSVEEDGLVTPLAPDRGAYVLIVTDAEGEEARHSYFIVPDPKTRPDVPNQFYAVDSAFSGLGHRGRFLCPWFEGDTYRMTAETMRYAGLRTTRDCFSWARTEKTAGAPDFRQRLKTLSYLQNAGVKVSNRIQDCPEWANRILKMPGDLVATYRFAKTAAQVLKDVNCAWEFFNEQDASGANEPSWTYVAAQKAFSLGLRAGAPGMPIENGAFSQDEPTPYGISAFANDLGKYIDIYNHHIYRPLCRYPTVLKELRDFLDKYDRPNRLIWVTESGVIAEGHSQEESSQKGLKMHSPDQERICAEFYPKSNILMQLGGIDRNFFFVFGAYNERGGVKDWGTLRRDGTLKPIYAAISTLTYELGGSTLIGELPRQPKVRAFLYRNSDGTHTLVAWRESNVDTMVGEETDYSAPQTPYTLKVPTGNYTLVDLCGARQTVASDGSLTISLDRYPIYLKGVPEMPVATKAAPRGVAGPIASEGEDLSVIFAVHHRRSDFQIIAGKAGLSLEQPEGHLTLEAWNLSDMPKRGTIQAKGTTVLGIPETVELPAWGKATFEIVCPHDPTALAGRVFDLEFVGTFEGKRTSKTSVRIEDRVACVAAAERLTLATDNPTNWVLNASANTKEVVWDEEEKALHFHFKWNSSNSLRWAYPRYMLQEGESLEGVEDLEFEVKSSQDKIENDYSVSQTYWRMVGVPESERAKFDPPRENWEKRRVSLKDVQNAVQKKGKPLFAFEIGGNPRGTDLHYWIRNLRFLRPQKDK